MDSLAYIVLVVIVIVVIFKMSKKLKSNQAFVPETEEEQMERKIRILKKQAEDRNIYEKSLKILPFYNKDKPVRTSVLYWDETEAKMEEEAMEKVGIVTYEHGNLIIKKDASRLSIIEKDEQGDKTVFEWQAGVHPVSGRYMGLKVCSYIPGAWERDIDQLFTKIQEEEKNLGELSEKQRKKEERKRFGL